MGRFARAVFLLALAALIGTLISQPLSSGAEASVKPSPSSSLPGNATPKPKPSGVTTAAPSLPPPGTVPARSTRTNPLPSSPTAPALITVDPSTIDPGVDNALNIFGRNLSAQTEAQVDTVPVAIIDIPDAWHLIVSLPKGSLHDGTHDIVLRNPDGQFDDARGALTAHSPGLPIWLYLVAGALACALVLYRVVRWLIA